MFTDLATQEILAVFGFVLCFGVGVISGLLS